MPAQQIPGDSISTAVVIPPSGLFRIIPTRSTISFTVPHLFGMRSVAGTMAVEEGDIVVSDTGQVKVAASALTLSFDTGNPKRDKDIAAAKFLDADRNPRITFRSKVATAGSTAWSVKGTLDAAGYGAPLELTVTGTVSPSTGELAINAVGRVDRYAHGITKMKGMIGRYLEIQIHATARKA